MQKRDRHTEDEAGVTIRLGTQETDIADLQLGTVKSRLHRGRKLLQQQLFDYAVKNGYIKDTSK